MEIIDIVVEYPSGLTITDRATLISELRQACISERLATVLREFAVTEAPPKITTSIAGLTVVLDQTVGGYLTVPETSPQPSQHSSWLLRRLRAFVPESKDQRQQFGRLMHTLSAGSLIGAIGFWHSTSDWTPGNILSEVNLFLAFVITYYEGMVSMKGE
ncbi:hypothetical protein [Paraburkholderia sp. BCC1876]|uniref:hypothetical protein n=1 Tax=Paraburkholderia sp. BCC1876 TaxID=2676303 RepID=UPI001590C2AF|nr:hypothetical protein [Paraburkholderia sp. BCC1876]